MLKNRHLCDNKSDVTIKLRLKYAESKTMAKIIDITQYKAAILDMDGVVTQTATVHAKAWKQMFDEFLRKYSHSHGKEFREFDIERDYDEYVDGMPRYDGVRKFLASRGITIPEGFDSTNADEDTIYALGKRKNNLFNLIVTQDGVEVYDDTVEKLKQWRSAGMKTAIVSSSKNCRAIIEKAGLTDMFDVRVDGVVSLEIGLDGKPAPDIFLEAAKRLGVKSEEGVVFEDAISGVQAGKAGKFGLVVGVARKNNAEVLIKHGADIAVSKLTELN